MASCDGYRQWLLDYVYDLLEGVEADELRAHLAQCAVCRSALSEAKAQQELLRRAAQVCAVVPPFEMPPAAGPEQAGPEQAAGPEQIEHPSEELLVDSVYGLLGPEEAERLQTHLAECGLCRESLSEAKIEAELLGRASRIDRAVPLFVAPEPDAPSRSFSAPETPARESLARASGSIDLSEPAPATIPLPRRARWRRWALTAAAAAILVALIGGISAFQSGLHQRRQALADARRQIDAIDAQFTQAQRDYLRQRERLAADVPARFTYLQVTAPQRIHGDAAATIRVETRDPDGKLQPGLVSIALLAPDNRELYRETRESRGDLIATLPPGLASKAGSATLVVERRDRQAGGEATASVRETVQLEGPEYVTHVAVSQSVYEAGELLFFRSVTLERFILKPPAQPLRLRFILRNAQGQEVKALAGPTAEGGIGGGEFAITGDVPDGDYTLEVTAADPYVRLAAARRRLEIRHPHSPRIQLDRAVYRAGEQVAGTFTAGRKPDGAAITANQAVTATLKLENSAPVTLQLKTDENGKAPFRFNLAAKVEPGRGRIELQAQDGKTDKVHHDFAVVSDRPEVEWFPEGGELIAGIPQRVYYRIDMPPGAPIDSDGRVIFLSGKKVLHDAPRGQGTGSFTLTPHAGETFAWRLTSTRPGGTIEEPLPQVSVHASGVSLSVPQSVSREGEPVSAIVRTVGAVRRLVVLATCQGRVVDQQFVEVSGETPVSLALAEGTRGIVRVTVYEPRIDQLVPLAERLIYRIPTGRLELAVEEGKSLPGATVQWNLRARDEQGAAVAAWLGIIVAQAGASPGAGASPWDAGLPAHFLLFSDLSLAEDIDRAELLLSDTPAGRQALDLYLGTAGWRRFVPRGGERATAVAQADDASAIFRRENAGREQLAAQATAAMAKAQDQLHAGFLGQRDRLENDKNRGIDAARLALAELSDYQEKPAEYFRMALGGLVLALLAVGTTCLIVGLVRMARRARSPTYALGSAFGALLACLILYVTAGPRTPIGPNKDEGSEQIAAKPWPPLPEFRQDQQRIVHGPALPAGRFAQAADLSRTEARQHPSLQALALRKGDARQAKKIESPPRILSQDRDEAEREWQERFAKALAGEGSRSGMQSPRNLPKDKPSVDRPGVDKPGVAVQPKKGTLVKLVASEAHARAFAHRPRLSPPDPPGTILWHPALFAKGSTSVSFHLPYSPASYRILLYGHTADGRLGAFQGVFDVPPARKE